MLGINIRSSELALRINSKNLQVYSPTHNTTIGYTVLPDGAVKNSPQEHSAVIDFSVDFVTKGLIDLQINGFAGVDFNRPGVSAEQVDFALMEIARTGVTSILPTVITDQTNMMIDTLYGLDKAISQSRLGALMVEGYHIEGPFLSKKDGFSGAHNPKYMQEGKAVSVEFIDKLQSVISRPILIMTVAPEVEGVIELIPELVKRNITVAIGHSAANLAEIKAAIKAGASLCTHVGNGLPSMLHKTENQIFWQLAQDELSAMFIADGVHLPEEALKVMLRAKDLKKTILTTDAVSAAGINTSPGQYTLGESQIELSKDRRVCIPGSAYLAGSSVTMDKMLRNLINWYGYTIPQILTMTQSNPGLLIGTGKQSCSVLYPTRFIEWQQTVEGPHVARAYIGPYTIE